MINQDEKNKHQNEESIINRKKKEECQDNSIIKQKLLDNFTKELEELEKKILEKKIECDVEIKNLLYRLENDLEKSKKFCLEKNILSFLPIIDNLERALDALESKKKEEKYIVIFEKIYDALIFLQSLLKEYNVKKIDEINIPFNPDIHQAMSIHYSDTVPSNTVVTIMQSGYIFHESRLLRPAMVIVSQKK